MPPQPIERKIYFYRANIGVDQGGQPLPFNVIPALQHIGGLQFSPAGRYLDDGDLRLCCWVDRLNQEPRLRLVQIRQSGLPQLEQQGQLTDLAIPANSGLAEAIHIVVFGNNIVGSDFNFFGPRMSRFSWYLREKGNGLCPDVTFEPLLRQDVAAQLERFREIRMFHLKIRSSYAAIVEQADQDLGQAFAAAHRAGDADELEIVLRPRKYSRNALADRVLQAARVLARRGDLRLEASKFSVKGVRGDTGALEVVDVLRDQLVAHEAVVRQSARGRALDSASAFDAIERAHTALESDLVIAAAVAQ